MVIKRDKGELDYKSTDHLSAYFASAAKGEQARLKIFKPHVKRNFIFDPHLSVVDHNYMESRDNRTRCSSATHRFNKSHQNSRLRNIGKLSTDLIPQIFFQGLKSKNHTDFDPHFPKSEIFRNRTLRPTDFIVSDHRNGLESRLGVRPGRLASGGTEQRPNWSSGLHRHSGCCALRVPRSRSFGAAARVLAGAGFFHYCRPCEDHVEPAQV